MDNSEAVSKPPGTRRIPRAKPGFETTSQNHRAATRGHSSRGGHRQALPPHVPRRQQGPGHDTFATATVLFDRTVTTTPADARCGAARVVVSRDQSVPSTAQFKLATDNCPTRLIQGGNEHFTAPAHFRTSHAARPSWPFVCELSQIAAPPLRTGQLEGNWNWGRRAGSSVSW